MQVEVALSPLDLARFSDLGRWNVAVIDVLRATSSMATAVNAGCRRILPAETLDAARALAAELGSDSPILAGERGGYRPDGFVFGNSPTEFTAEAVGGRTLIMATSNGSRAFKCVREARCVYAASFLNLGVTAQELANEGQDVLLVCAGTELAPGLEDVACAGSLAHRIREIAGVSCILADSAIVARNTYGAYPDALAVLWRSSHGRYLESIGFGSDLEVCAKRDKQPVLLVMKNGAIVHGSGQSA